jgi:glycosyltransferase involved in cell wall biosynthesis
MKRHRILVITPRYPYPVVGGDRLRIYEICRELSRYHELTLLSLCESRSELNARLPCDGIFSNIERVFLPKWRSILNVLMAIPTNIPLQIAYYKSDKFAEKLTALLPSHDLSFAHLIRTGEYLRSKNTPKILEMTDAISMNYQRVRLLNARRGIRSWIYRFEVNRLTNYERKIVTDFSGVILVSDIDRDFVLQGRVLENVIVSSNGVNLDLLPFKERNNSSPVAVFIGNMTSIQNLDACYYFAEEILPIVRLKIDCRFRVVGRINKRDARRLGGIDGVDVIGGVKDVAEAVLDARVGVAPVRLGAGVQNKVLEYMALGLPVITTSIALEGIQAKVGRDLLVANLPDEFASQLSMLWGNEALRNELSHNARAYVKCHHSWSERLDPIVKLVDQIVND